MRDVGEVLALSVLLAALLTTYAFVLVGLISRRRGWQALSGLLLPPLAPYWAWKHGMHTRAVVWIVLAFVYGALLSRVILSG